ncbi:hypothetical protein [Butyrivibrio sp. JL13D10]|uniref:hypothetical protein n=1 Tax=Butyrivibrio sp. JL13D10 TaxID=3236815 RepID=UPI0038B4C38B
MEKVAEKNRINYSATILKNVEGSRIKLVSCSATILKNAEVAEYNKSVALLPYRKMEKVAEKNRINYSATILKNAEVAEYNKSAVLLPC